MESLVQTPQPNGPVLLREAAIILKADTTAKPGPADVRRAIYKAVERDKSIPAGQRKQAMWDVWALVNVPWARRGWPEFATVEGWAAELRFTADDQDAVRLIGGAA